MNKDKLIKFLQECPQTEVCIEPTFDDDDWGPMSIDSADIQGLCITLRSDGYGQIKLRDGDAT